MGKVVATLTLVHRHPKILLGMKKRGFGAGRWNGFGGKVRAGERVEEAARRELLEEVGLTAPILQYTGVLHFSFADGATPIQCHVFRVTDFTGEPVETEEMRPAWFHVERVPYEEMWPDDREWIPLFLEGKQFEGKYHFANHDTVLASELTVVH